MSRLTTYRSKWRKMKERDHSITLGTCIIRTPHLPTGLQNMQGSHFLISVFVKVAKIFPKFRIWSSDKIRYFPESSDVFETARVITNFHIQILFLWARCHWDSNFTKNQLTGRKPLSGGYLHSDIDYQCTNLPRALLWCISAFYRIIKSDDIILSPTRAGLDDVYVMI